MDNVAAPGADTLMIIFLNNPYRLMDNDSISLRLNDRLVYKKPFRERDTLYLDIAAAGGGNYRPNMAISHNRHYYELSSKRNVYIGEGDKILYLVFCPTNNRNENFFIFSQKNPIL